MCEGNEDAERILYETIQPYLYFLAYRYKSVFLSVEDVLSYGWQGVIEALAAYDPYHKIAFKSFIRGCIQRRIIDIRRKNARLSNRGHMLSISLDEYEESFMYVSSPHLDELHAALNRYLQSELTDEYWLVYQAFCAGYKVQKIAIKHHKSEQTIYRMLRVIQKQAKLFLHTVT